MGHLSYRSQFQFLRIPERGNDLSKMSCCIHHITGNSTGSRQFTCSASIEHGRSQHITFHTYCIKYIIYHVERILFTNKSRSYHDTVSIPLLLADSQQFDSTACFFCIYKIFSRHFGNTLCINIFKIHLITTGKRSQDRNLSARIPAFHVCFRVKLRIALCLGFFQHIIIIQPFSGHLGQHVVSGSV